MIERHVTFNVHPDKAYEFEKLFINEYRQAMSSAPGFVRVELLKEIEQPLRYQMVLRFIDASSAESWRTSAVHDAFTPRQKALYQSFELVVYEVVG